MTLPISYFRFYFPEYVLKTRLPPNCTTGFLDSLKGPPAWEGLFVVALKTRTLQNYICRWLGYKALSYDLSVSDGSRGSSASLHP